MKRCWIPKETGDSKSTRTVTFYDCGEYWGQLVNNVWTCWKVTEREMRDGKVYETLEPLEEYIPWKINSVETYPLLNYNRDTITIPGWEIVFL
jgi:hypothetical protein